MHKNNLKNIIRKVCSDSDFDVLTPPDEKLGDYSVNLPFILAKAEKKNPAEVGKDVLGRLLSDSELKKYFDKIEFAPPGFINFYYSEEFLRSQLSEIVKRGNKFGDGDNNKNKINLEFVSANPTGPVTVGNARAASFGDTLANILAKAGSEVSREYYVNDVGKQVEKLGKSIINEIDRMENRKETFDAEGLYSVGVQDTARAVLDKVGQATEMDIETVQNLAIEENIRKIRESVDKLGVGFDRWFFESELHKSGEVEDTLELLKQKGVTFEKDGALWLKFGLKEDEVAVLIKSDKSKSYLMNDIAYTRNKFSRGFNRAINIWGTDHHGDVPRLKGGVSALNLGGELEILLHQLVSIKKGGESVRMSKRAGNIEKLDDLVGEVGKDATRFFFLAKDLNTHMEFDVDLAKEQSKKNPVFYIQYAYARLNQIFDKSGTASGDSVNLELLTQPEEFRLIRQMVKFPEMIAEIAENYQVHHLAQYAYELASGFHNFYEKHRIVQDDKNLERARLELCRAVETVLKLCLDLMGLTAPKRM